MTLPRRPLLPGLYHVVGLDDNRVQVSNAGRSVVLSGANFARRVIPLLEALDGRTSLDDLRTRFDDMVPSVLEALLAKGLLTDAAARPDGPDAAPQLAALALEGAPSPAVAVTRLARSQVLVAGCGPVGWASAMLLGKAGVGRLLLADVGPATVQDVAVSPPARPGDEGVARTELVRRSCLAATAASVEVSAVPGPGARMPPVDLALVELGCGDGQGPEGQGPEIAGCCLASGVRHLLYSQDALEAVVGPLVEAGGHPCHRCLRDRRLGHVANLSEHLAYRRHRAVLAPRSDAFLAAHVSIVAGVLATEALRALIGIEPGTRGGLLVTNLGRLTLERERLLPVPGCPGCAAADNIVHAPAHGGDG